MASQVEHFHDSIPNRLPLELLFYRNTLYMRSLCTVQLANYVFQFFNVFHDAASTSSPTLQKSRSIPASIAGVQRIALCGFTKL